MDDERDEKSWWIEFVPIFFSSFFFCKFFHLHRGQRREIDTRSCQINRREEEGEEEQEEILARLALQLWDDRGPKEARIYKK